MGGKKVTGRFNIHTAGIKDASYFNCSGNCNYSSILILGTSDELSSRSRSFDMALRGLVEASRHYNYSCGYML